MELQFIFIVSFVGISFGLKDVHIRIPTAVERGDSGIFDCWYDLEEESLYAVKWYKGRREFYRYTPKESPSIKIFPFGSLTVDVNESNSTRVYVPQLDFDATGRYSCEVSADAPSFQTEISSASMNVVELPLRGPSIHGLKHRYRIGDILRANCTSGSSRPAANLTWYINDRQPMSSYKKYYNPQESNIADQVDAVIGLQFLITANHFYFGKLKVRCSASIFDVYWQSTEVSAEEDRRLHPSYDPEATIIGTNYLQPPPNFQTEQRKPDGQVDVKVIGSSAEQKSVFSQMFALLLILHLHI